MTVKNRVKECEVCGVSFSETVSESNAQWVGRVACSRVCASRLQSRIVSIFDRLKKYQVVTDGCWGWTGTKDGGGYTTLSPRKGEEAKRTGVNLKIEKGHRVSYELHHGSIPKGLVVRHKCDNPECTNPDHLEVGTQKDNSMDMVERGRLNPISLSNLAHEKKLSAKQVEEIKNIKFVSQNGRGKGRTRKDVASEYGVCTNLIYKILKGK